MLCALLDVPHSTMVQSEGKVPQRESAAQKRLHSMTRIAVAMAVGAVVLVATAAHAAERTVLVEIPEPIEAEGPVGSRAVNPDALAQALADYRVEGYVRTDGVGGSKSRVPVVMVDPPGFSNDAMMNAPIRRPSVVLPDEQVQAFARAAPAVAEYVRRQGQGAVTPVDGKDAALLRKAAAKESVVEREVRWGWQGSPLWADSAAGEEGAAGAGTRESRGEGHEEVVCKGADQDEHAVLSGPGSDE